MKKQTTQSIKILILGLTIGLGVFITSAFTPPTTAPGTVAPSLLNSEPENQIKSGGLGVGSFLVSDYAADFWTNLTVGTSGNTSDILNIGYDSNGNNVGGSEITANMTLPNLTSSNRSLCVDKTGTLVLCPIFGVCGTPSGQPLSSAPTTNLCTEGTASSVTNINPWSWTCTGPDGSKNCSATRQICGTDITSVNHPGGTTRTNLLDDSLAHPTWLCASGSPYNFGGISAGPDRYDGVTSNLYQDFTAEYQWNCGAGPANCSTSNAQTNGICGSRNGSSFVANSGAGYNTSVQPYLCAMGSSMTDTAPPALGAPTAATVGPNGATGWGWYCSGTNGGSRSNLCAACAHGAYPNCTN